MGKNNSTKKWLLGLVLILIVYSCFYLLFADNPDVVNVPRKIRHVIKFAITILVYFIGTHFLGKIEERWMYSIWHFIHISFLVIITSVGLYDWTFGMVSLATKEFVASMQEILISPALYVGMGIVNQRWNSTVK